MATTAGKTPKKTYGYKLRTAFTVVVFGAFFAFIVHNAYSLMIVRNDHFSKLAEDQQERNITIPPKRGRILSHDGKELAISLNCISVYAHPHKIPDRVKAAKLLAPALGLSFQEISEALNSPKPFVWLKRRIDRSEELAFRALLQEDRKNKGEVFKGIGFEEESKRFYPHGSLAAHILGGYGLDKPLGGVELTHDKFLKGTEISLVGFRDAKGRTFFSEGYIPDVAREGFSLKLTIDSAVQYKAEKELALTVEKFEADRAVAIVMEPKTGKILAMASHPVFDPNVYGNPSSPERLNVALNFVYEPGSTFKVIVMAAALEEKAVSLDEQINCENGFFKVANATIKDVHGAAFMTPYELIQKSSNIGMAKLGLRMGRDKLVSYIKNFGFGDRVGVGLPGEERGILQPLNRIGPVEIATMSFGQGISSTPIQILSAVSALANGGVRMKPYIVEEIFDAEGKKIAEFKPETIAKVVGEQTAKTLTDMMTSVTMQGGTASHIKISGLKIAGKTGTSQVVDPSTKQYSKTHRISSFVAYMPAEDPVVSVIVVVDNPRKAYYGGTVAAPAVREISLAALKHLGLYTADIAERETPSSATLKVIPIEIAHAKEGVGIVDINREAEEDGDGTPDLAGLSLTRAIAVAFKAGLTIAAEGSGVVSGQEPAPGEPPPKNGEIKIFLKKAQGD